MSIYIDRQTAKVTVLMAVYNGERYLREAIDSILHQTFQDFEFLIIPVLSARSSRI
jgi:GT2 family glycosyltransferase